MAKPKAGDQTWLRIFHQWNVEAYESHENQGFYYKVIVKNQRPKLFYGETAHMDYQRYAMDNLVTF
jgi:hypothetical protein